MVTMMMIMMMMVISIPLVDDDAKQCFLDYNFACNDKKSNDSFIFIKWHTTYSYTSIMDGIYFH